MLASSTSPVRIGPISLPRWGSPPAGSSGRLRRRGGRRDGTRPFGPVGERLEQADAGFGGHPDGLRLRAGAELAAVLGGGVLAVHLGGAAEELGLTAKMGVELIGGLAAAPTTFQAGATCGRRQAELGGAVASDDLGIPGNLLLHEFAIGRDPDDAACPSAGGESSGRRGPPARSPFRAWRGQGWRRPSGG